MDTNGRTSRCYHGYSSCLWYITMALLFALGNCQYYQDVTQLLATLRVSYDISVPPTRSRDSHVTVKVYPSIIRINDIDAEKETLSATISLTMKWSDSRLSWKPANHGGIQNLFIPARNIWVPDIGVHNTVKSDAHQVGNDQLYEVTHIGDVTMVSVFNIETYCPINVRDFPRDTHICEVVFGSWIHSAKHVLLEFWQGELEVKVPVQADTDAAILPRGGRNWELMGGEGVAVIKLITYNCCPDEPYAQLKMSLTLRRNAPFLTAMLYHSLLVLSFLLPLQFLIPHDNSHRPVFGIIIVCSEVIFSHALSSYIPDNANVPTIGIVLFADLICSVLALFCTVFIINIGVGNTQRPLPPCLSKFINMMPCCRGSEDCQSSQIQDEARCHLMEHKPPDKNGIEMNNISNDNPSAAFHNISQELHAINKQLTEKQRQLQILNEWKKLATILDKVCLVICLVVFLANLIIAVK